MSTEAPPSGTEGTAPRANGVQSVDRAITVLEILARTGGAGVSEIAEEMGVHKSTASRLLSALDHRGVVKQTAGRGKYQLGFTILRLATAVSGRLDLVQEARTALEALVQKHAETANLAVLRSVYAVNVDQAMGSSSLATYDWIGSLTPLHATASGKVLLAALDPRERSRLLEAGGLERFTEKTVTSRKQLDKELEAVLAAGYATVYGEFEEGLNAVAVPVRDHRGEVVGSISMSGPAFRFDPLALPDMLGDIAEAGHRVSTSLGFGGA